MSSKTISTLVVGVILLLCGVHALAQTSAIEQGDLIKVTVLSISELGTQTIVDGDGKAALPLVGSVSVAGKSVSQAAADIRKALLKYVKNPQVTVEILAKAKWMVVVAGQVKKPGAFGVGPRTGVLELLAMAGGADTNADLTKVQLIRASDRSLSTINLQSFIDGKDPAANLAVGDGDVIIIPQSISTAGFAYVLGEVNKIGACELRNGMRVHEAVALSGGPTALANMSKCSIKRTNGEELQIDLKKALAQDPKEDVVLASGDTIYVPTSTGTFNIYGAVNKPGQYPITSKILLTDALTMAGGYNVRARVDKVKIIRADAKPVNVNIARVENQKEENVAIQPGDTISVPEAKGGTSIWTILGSVATVGWLIAR